MKELGDYLKEAREARNISLKDIQDSTKIRLTYLEAIERGDFSGLPGEVYCKGFLASFAMAVGLDPQEVLRRYHQLKGDPETPSPTASPTQAPLGSSSKSAEPEKRPRAKKSKSGKVAGFLVVCIGILLGITVVGIVYTRNMSWNHAPSKPTVSTKVKVKKHHKKLPVKPVEQVTSNASPTPSATTESAAKESAAPEPATPESTAKPTATETVTKQIFPAPVSIYASFTEPVWVRISKDGELQEDGRTYRPNDAQQLWTAQRELDLTIGNAAGIKLLINGKDHGSLGTHNQVLKLKITPDGNISKSYVNQ